MMKKLSPIKTACLAAAMLLAAASSYAAFRTSASYQVAPDGIAQGGGRATSVSYIATQQGIGEISGLTSSPSYRNQVGITQVDPATQLPVSLSHFQVE